MKRLGLLMGFISLLFIGYSCNNNKTEKQEEGKPKEETLIKDSGFSENAANELKIKDSLYELDIEKQHADYGWLTYKDETYIVNDSEVESIEILHFNKGIITKELHYPEVDIDYKKQDNGEVIVKSSFLKKNKLVLKNIHVKGKQIHLDVAYQGRTVKELIYHFVQEENREAIANCDTNCLEQVIKSIVLCIRVITNTLHNDCKMVLDICESHEGVGYVTFFKNGNCKESKCNFLTQEN